MNRLELIQWISKKYLVEPEYLWKKYPQYAVFRSLKSKKWFAIVMNISADKLGLKEKRDVDIVNVKVKPETLNSLLLEDEFFPAYHMNKQHWISILLNKNLNENQIKELIETSFELNEK